MDELTWILVCCSSLSFALGWLLQATMSPGRSTSSNDTFPSVWWQLATNNKAGLHSSKACQHVRKHDVDDLRPLHLCASCCQRLPYEFEGHKRTTKKKL